MDFYFKLTNGVTKKVNAAIIGIKGEPGKDGIVKFEDLTEEQKKSLQGKDGIGIQNIIITDLGNSFKITTILDNKTIIESDPISKLKGEKGDTGPQGPKGEPGKNNSGNSGLLGVNHDNTLIGDGAENKLGINPEITNKINNDINDIKNTAIDNKINNLLFKDPNNTYKAADNIYPGDCISAIPLPNGSNGISVANPISTAYSSFQLNGDSEWVLTWTILISGVFREKKHLTITKTDETVTLKTNTEIIYMTDTNIITSPNNDTGNTIVLTDNDGKQDIYGEFGRITVFYIRKKNDNPSLFVVTSHTAGTWNKVK